MIIKITIICRQIMHDKVHCEFYQKSVVKERRKRQALERRTKELERLSRHAVKHYDARLIEMASEVTNYMYIMWR